MKALAITIFLLLFTACQDDNSATTQQEINGFTLVRALPFEIAGGGTVTQYSSFPCNFNNPHITFHEMNLIKDSIYYVEIIPAYFADESLFFENLHQELLLNKDDYFVLFEYDNQDNLQIVRTSNDIIQSSGKKVGIFTEWRPTNITSEYEDFFVSLIKNGTITSDNNYGEVIGGDRNLRYRFRIKIEE